MKFVEAVTVNTFGRSYWVRDEKLTCVFVQVNNIDAVHVNTSNHDAQILLLAVSRPLCTLLIFHILFFTFFFFMSTLK